MISSDNEARICEINLSLENVIDMFKKFIKIIQNNGFYDIYNLFPNSVQ